mmetsp:Transcript_20946/g.18580  ORF Transcript_20946/g.18580 Transcript_20946/m.18580 type:complete len:115 (-) Transcript_20946:931-1275(-)
MGARSMNGVFSVINQFQLYILLPLAKSDMPIKIINFITGNGFSLFSFSFISIESLPGVRETKDYFNINKPSTYLERVGFSSQSSFVNHINLFFCFFLIGICHIISKLFKRCLKE